MAFDPKKPAVLVKIVEVVLCAILTGLCTDETVATTILRMQVIQSTFVGFLLLAIALLLCHAMGTPPHKHVNTCISMVAVVMHIATAGLLLALYVDNEEVLDNPIYEAILGTTLRRVLAAGVFSIINALVYVVDVGVSAKGVD